MNQAFATKFTQPEEGVKRAVVMATDPSDERRQKIATAAYLKAEARGFEPGYELEDWLAAEAELGDTA